MHRADDAGEHQHRRELHVDHAAAASRRAPPRSRRRRSALATVATDTTGGMPEKIRSGVSRKPPPTPNRPDRKPTAAAHAEDDEHVHRQFGYGEIDQHGGTPVVRCGTRRAGARNSAIKRRHRAAVNESRSCARPPSRQRWRRRGRRPECRRSRRCSATPIVRWKARTASRVFGPSTPSAGPGS